MSSGRRIALLAAVAATVGACVAPVASASVTTAYRTDDKALTVTSDDASDRISITCPNLYVEVNGRRPSNLGESPFCSQLRKLIVNGNGGQDNLVLSSSFSRSSFEELPQLMFYGGRGDDTVGLSPTDIPLMLSGETGNDRLIGGRAGDRIFGGPNSDRLGVSLEGGMGPDQFTGDCRDAIFARDRAGDDVLDRGSEFEKDRGDRLLGVWCGAFVSPSLTPPPSRLIAAGGVITATFATTRFQATRESPSLIQTPPPGTPQCRDGADNDGDGKRDYTNTQDYPPDPDCSSPDDDSEAGNAVAQCSDGADNDGDLETDYPKDPDCNGTSDNSEASASTSSVGRAAQAPTGSTIDFEISGPASRLQITVKRLRSGISRRRGRRPCQRRSRTRLRRIRRAIARKIPSKIQGSARKRRIRRALAKRRCDRLTGAGKVVLDNPPEGEGQASFTGLVGDRLLKRGRYLAIIQTLDADGKRSAPIFATFKIVE